MSTFDRPVKFPGTPEQAKQNHGTHYWWPFDDQVLCADCEAKPWHVAATYPCGDGPPRETVTIENPESDEVFQGMAPFFRQLGEV